MPIDWTNFTITSTPCQRQDDSQHDFHVEHYYNEIESAMMGAAYADAQTIIDECIATIKPRRNKHD